LENKEHADNFKLNEKIRFNGVIRLEKFIFGKPKDNG